MKRALPWLCLLSTCVLSNAYAAQCGGVDFPATVRIEGAVLSLNGLGMRKATFLKVHVYVAALYAAQPSHDGPALIGSDGPEELILHFVRGVGVEDLRKAWSEGFERTAKEKLTQLAPRVSLLNRWMTDVSVGQRLTFIRRPGQGIQVDVNGTIRGTIEGDDFAQAFLAIWLGPTPPNPELKSGLLGGRCE